MPREGRTPKDEAEGGDGAQLPSCSRFLPWSREDSVSFSSGKTPKSHGIAGGTYASSVSDELGRHLRSERRGAGKGRQVQSRRRLQKAPGRTREGTARLRAHRRSRDPRPRGAHAVLSVFPGEVCTGAGLQGNTGGGQRGLRTRGRGRGHEAQGSLVFAHRGEGRPGQVCVMTSSATEVQALGGGGGQGQITQAHASASVPLGEQLKVTVLTPRREDCPAQS